jgi:hypothetical protein
MSIHHKLPWAEIQREWETTKISLTALTRKHAIPSKTTMLRRRNTEGWVREVDAGAARPARGAVIADPAAITVKAEASEGGVATARHERAPRASSASGASADGEADLSPEAFLEAGRLELASLRDPIAARHLAMAYVVQETGLMLTRRLQAVLKPPVIDPDGRHAVSQEAAALSNLQRLIRVNPERETLTGLIRTAGKMLELGLNMERRALADMAARPQPKPSDSGKPRMTMRQMIDTMPIETVVHLRTWAVKLQQDQREAEINGHPWPPISGSD